MWLSSLFETIADLRSFRLGSIILCGLIFAGCGDVTIRQLGTENLQNLQQIAHLFWQRLQKHHRFCEGLCIRETVR